MPKTKKVKPIVAKNKILNDTIIIRGARVHNLKNVNLEIPRNKLVVFTGVSGSGKSSLAFDTIYAEGQRRFVESLSSYARQFLERLDKPDVDFIHGISPAIAIEQKTISKNPRSTVGTQTEIYDYLRLLFARIGKTYCRQCGKLVIKDSVQSVLEQLKEESKEAGNIKFYVLFPVLHSKSILIKEQIEKLRVQGFVRLLSNDEIIELTNDISEQVFLTCRYVLLDRIVFSPASIDNRIADSLESAFRFGEGKLTLKLIESGKEFHFNQRFQCADCGIDYREPEPNLFSFNTPFGACPECQGFGRSIGIDEALVIPNKERSIEEGAIHCWNFPNWKHNLTELLNIVPKANIRTNIPYSQLSPKEKEIIWNGYQKFEGINGFFEFLKSKSYKLHYRVFMSRYRGFTICNKCKGTRLREDALWIKVADKNIRDVVQMSLEDLYLFFRTFEPTKSEQAIASRLFLEIQKRLKYLVDVGLGYLTLDRLSQTLSGGESQRIHLSTALGTALVGALYVLDEPSIGLHSRDTQRLISIMKSLRDLGNTVIVVEHDREIIESADYIVDIGPNAGELGGEIVFQGTLSELKKNNSLTGKYLSGKFSIPVPAQRKKNFAAFITIKGAREHNLKNVDVRIPLKSFVCVTGVSGSGKSTLVHNILYAGLQKMKGEFDGPVGAFDKIIGGETIDNIELVDQTPLGRSSRSNPVTYLKIFDLIRDIFSQTQSAKVRGYSAGHFSFNVPGGRCEVCEGEGIQRVEMQFLAELELECDVCHGKRFKKEVLQIRFDNKNIFDVLNMTVAEAITFFSKHSVGKRVALRLKILEEVGLGYLRLGQSAATLSGGEAQRMKLASFLMDVDFHNHTLFIFDEPTTGLHIDDVHCLLQCFQKLLRSNHSLIIIEHNLDIIKCADWVIDLGIEGGKNGGEIVAEGTPEFIAANEKSWTGKFLRQWVGANV
ncbi:MAG: excinuclease ABC subunit UvrA [Ignavibacteriales bacterium]|nr:excinuclease ABC subunit UvrA [Ignavibacteriales bacterium]